MSKQRQAVALLFVLAVALFYLNYPNRSADFLAVWLAGKSLAMGHPDQVYAPVSDIFNMLAPPSWSPYMFSEFGYKYDIYPFLYPPIWAKLATLLSGMNWYVLTAYLLEINSALVPATIWLAWKATGQKGNPLPFVLVAAVFMAATLVGKLAMLQSQPQILVAFLCVLAVERSRARSDLASGVALAIAASIKLFPALFALYWLASGNRRAIAGFAVAGGALAAVSVLWAGWPLHALYLAQLRSISHTVFFTSVSSNYDALVAQLFYRGGGMEQIVTAFAQRDESGWFIMARPPFWRFCSMLAVVAALAATTVLYRRADHDRRHALIWPLGMTVLPLVMPFAWIYYFIAPAAFSGVLIDRLGRQTGITLLVVAMLPILNTVAGFYTYYFDPNGDDFSIYQMASVWCFTLLTLGFAWAALRPAGGPASAAEATADRPLHRETRPV